MRDEIYKMSEVFKALGDQTRLKIIKLLLAPDKLCVGMIAKKIGISQPAVSQHLKTLKNAGILDANRQGFHVHYNVNHEMIAEYKHYFDKLFNAKAIIEPCTECPKDMISDS